MPELLSVATAVPAHHVSSAETKEWLSAALSPSLAQRYHRVVDASGIQTRFIAVPPAQLISAPSLDHRNQQYVHHAVVLSEQAAARALSAAGVIPENVETVIPVSCSGYMMPSVDARLINRLGLRTSARRIPITELGCSAGVAALGLGAELLRHARSGVVLVVSVELCSLCLQVTEPSPADIMGAILFGDGAAATVLSAGQAGVAPEIIGARSVLLRDTLDELGMRLTTTGLRLELSIALPRLLEIHLRPVVEGFLNDHGVGLADLRFYAIHPGGPKVLDAVAASLQLADHALRASWGVLEQYGNMSSASVFFVLRELQKIAPPAQRDLGLMIAFGPGLTCELVLLRWQGRLAADGDA